MARRARAAQATFAMLDAPLVVTCGGRGWDGRVEADELARLLQEGGVPEDKILRERSSFDTHENAVNAARLLSARGVEDVAVVTCSWHLRRATMLFERAGLRVVDAVGAPPPDPTLLARAWWSVRERVSTWKDLLR